MFDGIYRIAYICYHGLKTFIYLVFFYSYISGLRLLNLYQMPDQHLNCDIIGSYFGVSRLRSAGKKGLYFKSVIMVHLRPFLPCFQRETIFGTFCLLTWETKSSQNGVFS